MELLFKSLFSKVVKDLQNVAQIASIHSKIDSVKWIEYVNDSQ